MKRFCISAERIEAEIERGGKLPVPEVLRCRVRYFCDGAIFRTGQFVNSVFEANRLRQCGPGYRASCEARHPGRREFLCDDLRNVRLDSELVRNPPIELWPSIEIRGEVPDDVNSGLIEPLR